MFSTSWLRLTAILFGHFWVRLLFSNFWREARPNSRPAADRLKGTKKKSNHNSVLERGRRWRRRMEGQKLHPDSLFTPLKVTYTSNNPLQTAHTSHPTAT